MLRKLLPPGLASIMFSADGGQGHHQVPFGGTKARLGSNPIALSFPYQEGAPFLADFATSAVAAGKVLVCHARGQKLKEGWMVDAEGKPTTNPAADYFKGGALLPLGGSEGHKGYALAFMSSDFWIGSRSGWNPRCTFQGLEQHLTVRCHRCAKVRSS